MELTKYDYIVIAVYFLLMFDIGLIFKKFNKNISEYFRSGGSMVWQLVGATTFISFVSSITYTGAAGKAYQTGTFIFVVYIANGVGFLISSLYFAAKYRQTRVITSIEIVRDRFGKVNEQFFTWLVIPYGLIHGGVMLYSLAIIIATVFGLSLNLTILFVGIVVLVVSLVGGSWALVATDFMQLLIMVPLALILAVLSINAVGGVNDFVTKLPSTHINWSELADTKVVWLWVIASFIKQFFSVNNSSDGYRFLGVKDSTHARKSALMAAILFFTVTIVWFIPPMAAAILFPDISTINELKPLGKKATEGIYLAMGIKLFPTGMIGVMICTIFSATISTLDHTLNRNAGIFVKNFYNPILRKKASDKELMVISYISTIILGGLTIFSALFFSKQEGLNLFDLNMKLGVMMSLPFLIPLTLGVVYKKTPAWAGWSTMVIGMIASWLIQNYLSAQWVATHLLHISRDISARELIDIDFFMGVFIIILLCTAWFFTTGLFFKNAPKAYKDTVEQFFQKINTPVDYQKEHGSAGNDREQFKILGGLCLAYATFFMLLMFIPNTFLGKSCFGFIGLINIIVGFLFLYNWKKGEKHIHEN